MVELLSRLNASDLSAVLILVPVVLVCGIIGLAAIIVSAIQRHRDREVAAAVVAEMLDRGIETQEIIAVLKAMGLEGTSQGLKRGGGALRTRREDSRAAGKQPLAAS